MTATYVYDALNRNVTTSYSNSPRTIERHYDGAVNGKGRLWYSNAGASTAPAATLTRRSSTSTT